MDHPIIRAVEAFPIDHDGQTYICLRDPTGLAPEPIMLGMGAYFIVTLFDGRNGIRDIQAAFAKRFGEILETEKIDQLVLALDGSHFLDSPSFSAHERAVRDEFLVRSNRPAALAGLCYYDDPASARIELATFFDPPEGPGRTPSATGRETPAGIIAPHIDPRRGAAAYAHAYAELMSREQPELVIILGTSHYGAGPELFSATRKDYVTPFGTVPTDRDFVDQLAKLYSGDLFADEILHRSEHSIEFQALFLAYALGVHGYHTVPILVSSFHEMIGTRTSPAQDPRVRSMLDALGSMIARERRKVTVLAAVDFAHVGRKFGDAFAADERTAEDVKLQDLALIENIRRGDPEGFFADIAKDGDARKICGAAPLYTQLALLSGRQGRLLKYGIAMEPQTESCVSFASLAID